eukprot:1180483-Prorocentrum_minimum.AAC.1
MRVSIDPEETSGHREELSLSAYNNRYNSNNVDTDLLRCSTYLLPKWVEDSETNSRFDRSQLRTSSYFVDILHLCTLITPRLNFETLVAGRKRVRRFVRAGQEPPQRLRLAHDEVSGGTNGMQLTQSNTLPASRTLHYTKPQRSILRCLSQTLPVPVPLPISIPCKERELSNVPIPSWFKAIVQAAGLGLGSAGFLDIMLTDFTRWPDS